MAAILAGGLVGNGGTDEGVYNVGTVGNSAHVLSGRPGLGLRVLGGLDALAATYFVLGTTMRWSPVAGEVVALSDLRFVDTSPTFPRGEYQESAVGVRVERNLRDIIAQYEWPQATAIRIAYCESGYNVLAVNGIHIGIYQVSLIHRWSADWLLIAENNVAAAYELYVGAGWQPWASSEGCWGAR